MCERQNLIKKTLTLTTRFENLFYAQNIEIKIKSIKDYRTIWNASQFQAFINIVRFKFW